MTLHGDTCLLMSRNHNFLTQTKNSSFAASPNFSL